MTFTGGTFPVSGTVTAVSGTGTSATQSTTNSTIAASTSSNTTVKASAGRLFSVTVTTLGTNAMQFTDGGTTVIFGLAASAAVGTYNAATGGVPFSTSLVALGNAANPAVTVSFA
jgi:hypothetical protein